MKAPFTKVEQLTARRAIIEWVDSGYSESDFIVIDFGNGSKYTVTGYFAETFQTRIGIPSKEKIIMPEWFKGRVKL